MKKCQCEPFQVCSSCYSPKLSKPGEKAKKEKKIKRVKKHNIEKPEKLHCRRCDRVTGQEAYRHLETFRKHELGKGVGTKCNDKATAYLCQECDNIMSNRRPDKNDEVTYWIHAEEWLFLVLKTWVF